MKGPKRINKVILKEKAKNNIYHLKYDFNYYVKAS